MLSELKGRPTSKPHTLITKLMCLAVCAAALQTGAKCNACAYKFTCECFMMLEKGVSVLFVDTFVLIHLHAFNAVQISMVYSYCWMKRVF